MEYFYIIIRELSKSKDHPDDEYLKVLKKFDADIKTAMTDSEKEKIFDAFINNYTVIPAIWDLIISHHYLCKFVNISKYLQQSINNLYFHISIFGSKFRFDESNPMKNKKLFSKCYEYARDYNISLEYFLTFPHSQLENEYKNCNEFSNLPISKEVLQKYEKAKAFAKRLLDTTLSHEEWIEILFEWDDPKFAIQNIEFRLIIEIWDKNLWKAYINAMETRNLKVMENIYFRYTRLFLSDVEMKRKYKNIKKDICKNIEYENLPDIEYFLFDEIPRKLQNFSFMNTFKYSEIQYFALPDTIIRYILACSRASLRLNLFKSCKSLFLLKSTPICHQLRISSDFKESKYLLQSLQICSVEENNFNVLSNLYITNRLEIKGLNIDALQQVIVPKLSKCDARFIFISQQVISIKEFEFLVNPSRIEKFYFDNGGITSKDGTVVNLRLILERLSNAYSIGINFNQKFELSPIPLSGLKRKTKIQWLQLKYFSAMFSLKDYCNFIVENASPNAKFEIGFSRNKTTENANAFNKTVNEFTLLNFSRHFLSGFEIDYIDERYKAINLTKIVHRKICYL